VTPAELQLVYIIGGLTAWAALTTVLIVFARRDVKLGLKKFFMLRFGRQPLKVRYHGPDNRVTELLVGMKGKGEEITLFDRKLILLKAENGMRFLIDEREISKTDDGVNEISYNYKSIMPVATRLSEEEVQEERDQMLLKFREVEKLREREGDDVHRPLRMDEQVRFTDPLRLNKVIDYAYMVAEQKALARATDIGKWVKIGVFVAGAACLMTIVIYYQLDSKMMPLLTSIRDGLALMMQGNLKV